LRESFDLMPTKKLLLLSEIYSQADVGTYTCDIGRNALR